MLLFPVLVICAIIWGEWLNFYYWRAYWNISQPKSSESLGVLIVADPQLVGFRHESHMLGPVTRWDSDRFLSKGFSHAVAATQPDLIVFLGDLFDEGLEASDTEIEWTISRFSDVFDSSIPVSSTTGRQRFHMMSQATACIIEITQSKSVNISQVYPSLARTSTRLPW
ncbi:hypothetical protein Y032_0936g3113 [Ancylostoma ceylanicum]|uniref:Calcineurin-like phosphoesterase domain-containing protein n=1 Tax=Ancylostoma ceylanicum TaxID=53326 RepID=A0A016W925_9BILA|nr:hypothetical protein Y032_0936g3113 [Ancylostoma ceylanicum]